MRKGFVSVIYVCIFMLLVSCSQNTPIDSEAQPSENKVEEETDDTEDRSDNVSTKDETEAVNSPTPNLLPESDMEDTSSKDSDVISEDNSELAQEETPVEPNETGSDILNLNQDGYLTNKNDWLYFSCVDSYQLVKMKSDGSERTVLIENLEIFDFRYLQVVGDWIYFIASTGSPHNTYEDEIYRLKTDGSQLTLLYRSYGIDYFFVEGNYLYYITKENLDKSTTMDNITKMSTDGSESTVIFRARDNNLLDDDSYSNDIRIYYVYNNELYFTQNKSSDISPVWKIGIDGNGLSQFMDSCGEFLYGERVEYHDQRSINNLWGSVVIGNYYHTCFIGYDGQGGLAYFPNDSEEIYKINNDLSFNVYVINDDWVYYITYYNYVYSLCRVHIDGSGWEELFKS